jgi:FlaA1/EpsC-like NDP-sugar epimerase
VPIYTFKVQTSVEHVDWFRFLGRPRLPAAQPSDVDTLQGKTILITGAGGSIGSALARRLAALNPRRLILLESSENNLHDLDTGLREAGLAGAVVSHLGSINDRPLLDEIFAQGRPQWIFHTAAHKHVALLEAHPIAALRNNVLGTSTIVDRSRSTGSRVILVSTDKAVAPASVMGATKRLAESIVLASGGTVLRLGNVLGSRGSVVETFLRQIAQNQPLTITHSEARRYFMVIEESVELLLRAASESATDFGQQPAPPLLFAAALDHTYPVRDLAEFLVQEVAPHLKTKFLYTGLKAGEKLVESLCGVDEVPGTAHGGLLPIQTNLPSLTQFQREIEEVHAAVACRDTSAGLALLERLVQGYTQSKPQMDHASIPAATP